MFVTYPSIERNSCSANGRVVQYFISYIYTARKKHCFYTFRCFVGNCLATTHKQDEKPKSKINIPTPGECYSFEILAETMSVFAGRLFALKTPVNYSAFWSCDSAHLQGSDKWHMHAAHTYEKQSYQTLAFSCNLFTYCKCQSK